MDIDIKSNNEAGSVIMACLRASELGRLHWRYVGFPETVVVNGKPTRTSIYSAVVSNDMTAEVNITETDDPVKLVLWRPRTYPGVRHIIDLPSCVSKEYRVRLYEAVQESSSPRPVKSEEVSVLMRKASSLTFNAHYESVVPALA